MSNRSIVFISYSHEDASWLMRLRVHLRPLEREHKIKFWDDTKIKPGSKWKQEIETALSGAMVAILLVSADFLASDFIVSNELPPLLEAAENDGAIILPVIVSPSRFLKTNLAQFQAINDPSRPLVKLTKGEQEDVYVEVAERIEAAFAKREQASEGKATEPHITELSNISGDILRGIPISVYYKAAHADAKRLHDLLLRQGMVHDTFADRIGFHGPRTIAYHPTVSEAAEWMHGYVSGVHGFELHELHPKDEYYGIVVNLW